MALAPRFHTVIAGPARKNDPQVIEAICKVAILPGSLVELDASGQFIYHATAGGPGVALAMQHNYIGGGDIREDMADYMLSGDAKVKVKGYVGAGITNHANTNQVDLSASGLNIDLTISTPDESVAFFTGPFAKLLDDNYVQEKVKLWASPDIMRNLNRPYSDAAGFKEGTVLEYILRYGRIESFNQTFKLTGNHFIAYVRNSQYIKTRIAAPVGTFMIPRQNPFDNYNTLVWSAVGLQIKRDFNGRSKVFNAQG